MEKYCIVKFSEENDAVQVVPLKWIKGEICYWPPSDRKIQKQIKKADVPDTSWKTHQCIVLKEFDSYADAQAKVGQAMATSDLDTPVASLRSRNKRKSCVSKMPTFPSINENGRHQDDSAVLIVGNEDRAASQESSPSHINDHDAGLFNSNESGVIEDNIQDSLNPDMACLGINESLDHINVGAQTADLDGGSMNDCLVISNREHESKVVRELALVRATLAQHGEILEALLQQKNIESRNSESTADINSLLSKFQFPISSEIQIQRFDDFTKTEEGLRLGMKYLAGSGGAHVDEAVQRMLSKLISDEMLATHSLKGKRNKTAFISFHGILSLLKECSNTNPALNHLKLLGKLDDDSVLKGISLALKKACDRHTQRQKRVIHPNEGH